MTNSMGAPPPKNPNPPDTTPPSMPPPPCDSAEPSPPPSMPPPPCDSAEPSPPPPRDSSNAASQGAAVPYKIPPWSAAPCHEFYLEVLKDGSIIGKFNVFEKGAYMFGRLDLCDFVLEHPTISRFHAVVQFKRSGDAYLYDLGSTHGTFLNKNQQLKNKMQKEAKAHRSSCLPQETKHPLNPTIYAIHKPHLSLAQTHEAATKSFPAASRSRRPSTSGSPSSAALSQLASTSAPLTMVLSTKTSSKDQLHPRSDPPTPPIYTSYPD
ncbi:hypothetical protein JHK85_022911 [Glycine max]|nr:hypothetical protein JHK85_022911 [Glycine max]